MEKQGTETEGPFANYVAPDGAFKQGWADGLPESMRDIAPTVSRFATLPEAFSELHRLSALQGDAVRVPSDLTKASAEEIKALRTALGAPENADSYGLSDKELAALFDKHHVPASAAKEFAELESKRKQAAEQAAKEEQDKYVAQELGKLKAEWGDKLQDNVAAAKVAAEKLGIANLDEIGDAKLIQMFHRLHSWMSEDSRLRTAMGIPDGSLSIMAENPRSSAVDIMTNPQNPLYNRYISGDPEIVKQVTRMMAKANGEA